MNQHKYSPEDNEHIIDEDILIGSPQSKFKDPQEIFSSRFSSILFSLYNPQIVPNFDTSLKSGVKAKSDLDDKFPSFDSPLCQYKIEADLEEGNHRDIFLGKFNERARVFAAEIRNEKYVDDFSMVPFDIERSPLDRGSASPPKPNQKLEEVRKQREKQQAESLSQRRQNIRKEKEKMASEQREESQEIRRKSLGSMSEKDQKRLEKRKAQAREEWQQKMDQLKSPDKKKEETEEQKAARERKEKYQKTLEEQERVRNQLTPKKRRSLAGNVK